MDLLAALPPEILVVVASVIAATSLTPLRDIFNLSQSCKRFREATAAREVWRCMAVQREWKLYWWKKERFLSLLRLCAECDNLEASFILGLEFFCTRREDEASVHLDHAMEHGNPAAAYMIGMITLHHHWHSITEQALQRLDWFWTRCRVASVRREAVSVMRALTMRRLTTAEPPTPCSHLRCGKVVIGEMAAWGDGDGDDCERTFCSSTCRWKREYRMFIQNI